MADSEQRVAGGERALRRRRQTRLLPKGADISHRGGIGMSRWLISAPWALPKWPPVLAFPKQKSLELLENYSDIEKTRLSGLVSLRSRWARQV